METRNILLIHNSFEPYRIPLFNELARQKGIRLTVLFLSTSRSGKEAYHKYASAVHFRSVFLSGVGIPFTPTLKYYINPSIVRYLFDPQYDVVLLGGWQHFASQVAAFWRILMKKPYIIWSNSTQNEDSIQRRLTRPLVRWFVTRASACIAGGTAAKEYLQTLGVRAENINIAFNTVDILYFSKKGLIARRQRKKIRRQYGVRNDRHTVILSVGQFIHRKGIDLLIRAFAEAIKIWPDMSLWIIGQGPLKSGYRAMSRELHIQKYVRIIPYVENMHLATFYGAADIFVLPSREDTWGLVVNEAMACGLPVIVSTSAGSAKDLVHQGKNGYTLPIENHNEFVRYIRKLSADPVLRLKMGKESAKMIGKFAAEHSSRAFVEAINASLHTQ